MSIKKNKGIVWGAGVGMIFGAAVGNPGIRNCLVSRPAGELEGFDAFESRCASVEITNGTRWE